MAEFNSEVKPLFKCAHKIRIKENGILWAAQMTFNVQAFELFRASPRANSLKPTKIADFNFMLCCVVLWCCVFFFGNRVFSLSTWIIYTEMSKSGFNLWNCHRKRFILCFVLSFAGKVAHKLTIYKTLFEIYQPY